MLDLGVGLEWHDRRRRERASGDVEALVRSVKNSFFRTRGFADPHDLQRRLEVWNRDVNTRALLVRATKVVPAERISEERRRLRPLPVRSDDFALRVPVIVGMDARVIYDGVPYPMPQQTIGMRGTLHLYSRRVLITVAGFRSEQHPRPAGGGAP
jgi:hypothetical protein